MTETTLSRGLLDHTDCNQPPPCRCISDRTYQYHRDDGCVLHIGNTTESEFSSVIIGGGSMTIGTGSGNDLTGLGISSL